MSQSIIKREQVWQNADLIRGIEEHWSQASNGGITECGNPAPPAHRVGTRKLALPHQKWRRFGALYFASNRLICVATVRYLLWHTGCELAVKIRKIQIYITFVASEWCCRP